jgi:hypothetical protein
MITISPFEAANAGKAPAIESAMAEISSLRFWFIVFLPSVFCAKSSAIPPRGTTVQFRFSVNFFRLLSVYHVFDGGPRLGLYELGSLLLGKLKYPS